MCTYQSTGLVPSISDFDNGPDDAYWTLEISFPTNDIVVKWKIKGGMTGRVNEVKWLLSNHLHVWRGEKLAWNLSKEKLIFATIWKHSIIKCFKYYVSCLYRRGFQDYACNRNEIYGAKLFENIKHVWRLKHTTQMPLGLGMLPYISCKLWISKSWCGNSPPNRLLFI